MSIRQFLRTQSEQTPAAIAIKDAVAELTYEQLNNKINQLANYLRKQGVEPDVLVGVYAERSIDLVVSILAVIQAGGAYVPLDPVCPQARLESMLAETKLSLLLTQTHLAPNITDSNIRLLLLDAQQDEISRESIDLVPAQTTPNSLAYIMYTSGSTGNPQGVKVTVGQIESYLQAVNQVMEIQSEDIYLHSASFTFSSSIRQLLVPLSQGAKLVISSKENNTNLNSLLELIKTENITVFDTVASVWNYLLINLADMSTNDKSQLIDSQLRLLIFSGGLLTAQLLDQVRNKFAQSPQIINIYGQTETIGVCAYRISPQFKPSGGYVPVGLPYDHLQLYLLDDLLQPVTAGATGSLYVAGVSSAGGYLNNPQLNAKKYIPNPFTTIDRVDTLYQTGDLARYLPDGNLELIGRQDFQLKIRGMRVEIEEIETVLMQHPTVQQAAVIGKKDQSGEQIMIAYLVFNRSNHPETEDLAVKIDRVRSFLKMKLSDYMIPSAFEVLDALPLTPNNKLDRKNLAEPSRTNITVTYPRDEVETHLIEIWQKVLGIDKIGINDNFFDLGGHSLIALQLFTEIEKIWKKRLLLAVLLESPTIAELANVIRQADSTSKSSPLVVIKSGGDRSPLFCPHPIGGNLFDYYSLSKNLDLDRPIYGLQARGIDGKESPLDRVEDMGSYFVEAIQTIQPHGPYLLLGYSFGGIIAFEIARQLVAQGEQIDFLGLLDIAAPTIPDVDPPFPERLSISFNKLQKLTFRQQLKYLVERIIYHKKMSYRSEIVTTLYDLNMFTPELLNILDCNIQSKKDYRPQIYSGKATLFWTESHIWHIDRYPDLGWGDLVAGGLEIEHIPGTHSTLMKEPHVQVLARKLRLLSS